jgi:hypothetical protein
LHGLSHFDLLSPEYAILVKYPSKLENDTCSDVEWRVPQMSMSHTVDCDVTDFYILSSCSIKFDRGVLNLSVIVSLQLSVFSGVATCVLKVCYGVFMIIISS